MPSDGAAELLFFCLRTLAGKYSLSCFLYKNKTKQNKSKHENNTDISIVNCNLLQLNKCYHGKQKIAYKRFVMSKEVNLSLFSGIQFWWRLAIYDCQKQGKNFHFFYNFRLALSEAMISDKKGQKFKPKTNKVMLWKSKWPMDYKSHRLKSQNMICIEIESENKVFIWGAYHLHKPPGWKSFV